MAMERSRQLVLLCLIGHAVASNSTAAETSEEVTGFGRPRGSTSFIGVSIAIIGSAMGNFGTNVQKYVHRREQQKPEDQRIGAYYTIPLWWLGFLLVFCMSFGDIIALAFATQALVVASGGATTLIVNNIFAKLWHKEQLSNYVIGGVSAVVAGAILLAIYAPERSEDLDLEAIYELSKSTYFVTYVGLIFVLIGYSLSHIASSSMYKSREAAMFRIMSPFVKQIQFREEMRRHREKHMWRRIQLLRGALLAVLQSPEQEDGGGGDDGNGNGNGNGNGGAVQQQQQDMRHESPLRQRLGAGMGMGMGMGSHQYGRILRALETGEREETARATGDKAEIEERDPGMAEKGEQDVPWGDAFVYAVCSGVIGSMSVLFANVAVNVFKSSIKTKSAEQWKHIGPYIFIALMIACVLSQTHLLQKALQLGEVLTVFPTFQAFFIGFGVIGGMVFYQESAAMTNLQWGMSVLAAVLMLVTFMVGQVLMLTGFYMLIMNARTLDLRAHKGKEEEQQKRRRLRAESRRHLMHSHSQDDLKQQQFNLMRTRTRTQTPLPASIVDTTIDAALDSSAVKYAGEGDKAELGIAMAVGGTTVSPLQAQRSGSGSGARNSMLNSCSGNIESMEDLEMSMHEQDDQDVEMLAFMKNEMLLDLERDSIVLFSPTNRGTSNIKTGSRSLGNKSV